MLSDPNLHHVEQALQALDLLVVQDIFPNETARMADVVLPGVSFAEKSGTFTNTERRVQLVRPALARTGRGAAGLVDLAGPGGAARRIMALPRAVGDLRRDEPTLTPSYAGMDHARLEGAACSGPARPSTIPGRPSCMPNASRAGWAFSRRSNTGLRRRRPTSAYPLLLSTGRILYHWHGGTLSRRSAGLDWLAPEAEVEIHPDDAAALGIEDGEMIEVRSRRGTVRARAKVTTRSPQGTVFMTFHYAEAAANLLTIDAVDPVAKIPEYKVAAVRLERIIEGVAA